MEYDSEIKHKWTTDICYEEEHQNIVLEARSKTTGCMIPFTSNDKKKQKTGLRGIFQVLELLYVTLAFRLC